MLENRSRETRIVSDLLAGVIITATCVAIVAFAFKVPFRGLLATSVVIAIVLGLALQSTLSDVFSASPSVSSGHTNPELCFGSRAVSRTR